MEITPAGEKVVTETFERRTRLIMAEITELGLTAHELAVLHEAQLRYDLTPLECEFLERGHC